MVESPFDLLNKHVKISHETFNRLTIYHDLLSKWQPKINLVGSDTISDSWNRHFLDSLQLIMQMRNLSDTIIDFGSGAGFPGLILAIYGASNVHLIESDSRKIIFMKEVARLTQTEAHFHNTRIENGPKIKASIITSRACSELNQLLSLSLPYVSHETICLFHKGKNYSKEIMTAQKNYSFGEQIFPSIVDKQGIILKLTNIRSRGYDDSRNGRKT